MERKHFNYRNTNPNTIIDKMLTLVANGWHLGNIVHEVPECAPGHNHEEIELSDYGDALCAFCGLWLEEDSRHEVMESYFSIQNMVLDKEGEEYYIEFDGLRYFTPQERWNNDHDNHVMDYYRAETLSNVTVLDECPMWPLISSYGAGDTAWQKMVNATAEMFGPEEGGTPTHIHFYTDEDSAVRLWGTIGIPDTIKTVSFER